MLKLYVLALAFLVAHALRENAEEVQGDLDLATEELTTGVLSVLTGNSSLTEEKHEVSEGLRSNISISHEMLEEVIQARHAAYNGTRLLDRFVLLELQSVEAQPGKVFPKKQIKGYSHIRHLGKGGFGDTWKGYDSYQKKYVAVKIFYSGNSYISAATRDRDMLEKLSFNSHECKTIEGIASAASKISFGVYVQYLCLCLEDHINDGKYDGTPAFLVYELCGDSITSLIEDDQGNRRTTADVYTARTIVNHIVRGLRYLNAFDPAWIHHDLKPDNVCWMAKEQITKIIDWGGMIQATKRSKTAPSVGTLAYMDPATQAVYGNRGVSWVGYSWSYDMFATGLIYAELICPSVTINDWMEYDKYSRSWQMKKWSPKDTISRMCKWTGMEDDLYAIELMVDHNYKKRPSPKKLNTYLENLRHR